MKYLLHLSRRKQNSWCIRKDINKAIETEREEHLIRVVFNGASATQTPLIAKNGYGRKYHGEYFVCFYPQSW